jgi:hypothetical protein
MELDTLCTWRVQKANILWRNLGKDGIDLPEQPRTRLQNHARRCTSQG